MSRCRVFIASSLDGFIAGPNDELDWLDGHGEGDAEDTFTPFMKQIGALLMGRRTYDVVCGFDAPWPYGETPVLVASSRPVEPKVPTVRGVSGDIHAVVAAAKEAAGDRDVYLDGGALIRAALDEGLVEELVVTMIPYILGDGVPLFAGVSKRKKLELVEGRPIGGGMVQLVYRFFAR